MFKTNQQQQTLWNHPFIYSFPFLESLGNSPGQYPGYLAGYFLYSSSVVGLAGYLVVVSFSNVLEELAISTGIQTMTNTMSISGIMKTVMSDCGAAGTIMGFGY